MTGLKICSLSLIRIFLTFFPLHVCLVPPSVFVQVTGELSWLLPKTVTSTTAKNSNAAEAATPTLTATAITEGADATSTPAGTAATAATVASAEQSPRAVVAAAQPERTTSSTSTKEPAAGAAAKAASHCHRLEPLLAPPSVACVGGDGTPNDDDNANPHDLGSHPEDSITTTTATATARGSHNDYHSTVVNGTQQVWDPASFRWFWRMACEERQQMLPSSSSPSLHGERKASSGPSQTSSSSSAAPELSTTSSSASDNQKLAAPMATEETTPSIADSASLLPAERGVEERSAAAVAITAASD